MHKVTQRKIVVAQGKAMFEGKVDMLKCTLVKHATWKAVYGNAWYQYW